MLIMSFLLYILQDLHCLNLLHAAMAEAPVVKCTNEEEPQEESSCFMSLLCFEPDRVCHSLYDQTLLSDDRILRNLLIAEECCLPNATYFDFQPEIKPQMRCVLANWMLDVGSCFL
jgi:hypothetical protein